MNEQVKSIDVEEVNVLSAVPKKKRMSLGKRIAACLAVAVVACSSMALSVSATDGETSEATPATINTVMSNSFDGLKDDLIGTANAVMLPALGVFGVTFCVKKGKKIFRTMSN